MFLHLKVYSQAFPFAGNPNHSLSKQHIVFRRRRRRQLLLLLFQAGCCSPVSCLLQQAYSPDSQPPSKKKKKSSWQGEAYFGRFLPANRLSGSRPNLRNCHRRRLRVEVFGSGLSELRAQLAHGHALTCTRSDAHARPPAALSPDLHRHGSFQVRSWRRVHPPPVPPNGARPRLQQRRNARAPGLPVTGGLLLRLADAVRAIFVVF